MPVAVSKINTEALSPTPIMSKSPATLMLFKFTSRKTPPSTETGEYHSTASLSRQVHGKQSPVAGLTIVRGVLALAHVQFVVVNHCVSAAVAREFRHGVCLIVVVLDQPRAVDIEDPGRAVVAGQRTVAVDEITIRSVKRQRFLARATRVNRNLRTNQRDIVCASGALRSMLRKINPRMPVIIVIAGKI